jgi:hypothetical protein
MRIGYLSSSATSALVTVGGHHTRVPFHAGLGAVYVVVDGAVDNVDISALRGGGTVCTDELTVGNAVPADGAQP